MTIDDLSKIRFVRSEFANATISQLQAALETLNRYLNELVQAEEEKRKNNEERRMHMKEVFEMMQKYNLSSKDFDAYQDEGTRVRKNGTVRRPVEPKYEYHDDSGKYCTWTGRGRTPVSFAKILEMTGQNREEFLIKKNSEQKA